jgi:hypothetical protein
MAGGKKSYADMANKDSAKDAGNKAADKAENAASDASVSGDSLGFKSRLFVVPKDLLFVDHGSFVFVLCWVLIFTGLVGGAGYCVQLWQGRERRSEGDR